MAQMKSAEVAKEIGVKSQTLRKLRMQGRGPKCWVKHSKTLVTYEKTDVAEYLATHKHGA